MPGPWNDSDHDTDVYLVSALGLSFVRAGITPVLFIVVYCALSTLPGPCKVHNKYLLNIE